VYRAEGLAANQVGELVRMFVIRDAVTEEYITCINPEILASKTDLLDSKEGCLSFPGVNETVKRSEAIHVRYQDEGGQVQEVWFTGVNAVAFQHELDHLNGILFTKHMGKLQKRMALKKLAKVQRHGKRQFKQMQKILAQAERRATV
jgi:peptide deformylase